MLFILSNMTLLAQDFNSVFPITKAYTSGPDFVIAHTSASYKTLDLVDRMAFYRGSDKVQDITWGNYLSFNYVFKEYRYNTDHDTGYTHTTAKQIVFYPGGNSKDPQPSWEYNYPLYAFLLNSYGLCMYDISENKIVAVLAEGKYLNSYSSITVISGYRVSENDIIIITGDNLFQIYESLPNTQSAVRSIYKSKSAPSFYTPDGLKSDQPSKGLNIMMDGDKVKKIVVK